MRTFVALVAVPWSSCGVDDIVSVKAVRRRTLTEHLSLHSVVFVCVISLNGTDRKERQPTIRKRLNRISF